jgi:ribonucleoside-diphosphate reductase alpha chain
MYFAAVTASMEMAKEGPYSSFAGFLFHKGIPVQFMGIKVMIIRTLGLGFLRKEVMEHGVRNSLVVAQCQLHLNFWVTTKL